MKNRENEKYLKIGITGAAIAAFGIAFFFVLANLQGLGNALAVLKRILKPFIYGAVIAYLVLPLCRKLEKTFRGWCKGGKGRWVTPVAIVLSLLIALLIILAVFLLIVPGLVSSIRKVLVALPAQMESARNGLDMLFQDRPPWMQQMESVSGEWFTRLEEMIHSGLSDIVELLLNSLSAHSKELSSLAQSLLNSAASVAGVLFDIFLGTVVAIYLLARRKQLGAQAKLVLHGLLKPSWAEWVEKELHLADRMFNGFFMGKLLDSAIVGVICFIGCLLMRFESPVLIAVIVGVTNIIPFFGPYIGAVPCSLLLLLENPIHCVMFLVFLIVLQQLDGNFIGPHILGSSTGLSSIWVMFAILFFGGLWGIVGMIVGVPLMAVIYDISRQLTFFGIRRHGQEELIEDYNVVYHAPEPEQVSKKPKKKKRS